MCYNITSYSNFCVSAQSLVERFLREHKKRQNTGFEGAYPMRKMILSSLAVFLGVSVLLGGIRTSVDAWHHRTIRCNGFVVVPVSLPVLADRLILDRKDNHEWGKALCDLTPGSSSVMLGWSYPARRRRQRASGTK